LLDQQLFAAASDDFQLFFDSHDQFAVMPLDIQPASNGTDYLQVQPCDLERLLQFVSFAQRGFC
jgi:hypothetical protein